MTLFEAIRELREGQYINIIADVGCICGVYAWEWGEVAPKCVLDKESWGLIKGWANPKVFTDTNVRIYDLPKSSPKPKMTLEEGLYKAAEAIPYELLENPSPRQFTKHFVNTLRYLPIDWQAEADRKDNLK